MSAVLLIVSRGGIAMRWPKGMSPQRWPSAPRTTHGYGREILAFRFSSMSRARRAAHRLGGFARAAALPELHRHNDPVRDLLADRALYLHFRGAVRTALAGTYRISDKYAAQTMRHLWAGGLIPAACAILRAGGPDALALWVSLLPRECAQ